MRASMQRAIYGALAGAAFAGVTSAANAQPGVETTCIPSIPGNSATADACQKVVDIFRFLSPQVGVALAGGNPVLGDGGTLGGGGKSSVSVRATVVDGWVPANDVNVRPGATPIASNFGAQRAPIPVPTADIATGLYRGKPVGLTNVLGIDLLLGITYIPDVNKDALSINSKGSGFALAYGVRVGVVQESAAMPGISVSYRSRKLPNTNILYTPNNDTLTVRGAQVDTKAYRIVAGKHFKFLGLAGGYGRDQINAKSLFEAVINEEAPVGRYSVTVPGTRQNVTRSNAFVNLSLGLPKAQLVGEMGWTNGRDNVETFNTFDGRTPNDKYRYYSVGFTFRP